MYRVRRARAEYCPVASWITTVIIVNTNASNDVTDPAMAERRLLAVPAAPANKGGDGASGHVIALSIVNAMVDSTMPTVKPTKGGTQKRTVRTSTDLLELAIPFDNTKADTPSAQVQEQG